MGRPLTLILGVVLLLAAAGIGLDDNLGGPGPIDSSDEMTALLFDLGLPPQFLDRFLLAINAAVAAIVFALFLLVTYCVLVGRPWVRAVAVILVLSTAVSAVSAQSGMALFVALLAAAGTLLLFEEQAAAWLRLRQTGPSAAGGSGTADDADHRSAGSEADRTSEGRSGSRFFDLVAREDDEDVINHDVAEAPDKGPHVRRNRSGSEHERRPAVVAADTGTAGDAVPADETAGGAARSLRDRAPSDSAPGSAGQGADGNRRRKKRGQGRPPRAPLSPLSRGGGAPANPAAALDSSTAATETGPPPLPAAAARNHRDSVHHETAVESIGGHSRSGTEALSKSGLRGRITGVLAGKNRR